MRKAIKHVIISNMSWLVGACIFTALYLILPVGPAVAETNLVTDTENCLLCHRYPSMGRFDETGKKRILYINEKKFAESVHGKLKCKSCHVGLNEIPHKDVKKVDCTTNCHIIEPSTQKEFSHSNMADKFRAGVHGMGSEDNPKPFKEDLPTCKYCHSNRIIKVPTGMMGMTDDLSKETLTRCKGCHTEEQWAQRFYAHFTNRMRRKRSHKEIVALCTSCHEDKEKMARHGLETIETYKDTFHWIQVKYGVENAPDCLSCHVPVGYSAHDMRPRKDPLSAINMANRINTCSNQGGTQSCHSKATYAFSTGRVHAYGAKALIMAKNSISDLMKNPKEAVAVNPNDKLLVERAKQDIPKKEVVHYIVLTLIRLFYQVLIGTIIGGMFLHQGLHYLRERKKRKKAHRTSITNKDS
jgi:hypothetical protein